MHDISTTQRTTYLRGLLQGYGTLSLPLGSGLSFSLLQIFQPLRLRQSATDEQKQQNEKNEETPDDTDEDNRKNGEPEDPDVLAENGIEALNKSEQGRMVILGGPGTGKTTVLKHLLYHHAQLALEERAAPLPIFLSLPELARMGQDLDAYLVHIVQELGLATDYAQTLSQAIEHGHAFVCLDSLDEVLPRQRAGIIRQVNELAQKNGNSWIVGSRFTDYKGGQFEHGQFQEWELQPLDQERRLRLATQLLPELQRQLAIPTQSTPSPQAYVQALGEHRQAATWGTNPLLFSLGAVAYLRRGTLTGSRAMLYREVINALLETRGGDVQLRHILAHSSLELYQAKGRTFTREELHAALISLNTEQQASWSVEEMGYRVLNSGVLDVVAAETYSFRHQTLQEYLAASALAECFMSADEQTRMVAQQLAWSKHTYSRWNQIERLLVGILVQEYAEAGTLQARAWFIQLLERRVTGDPGNLSLELAINVLGEVAQLQEWQAAETLELEEMAATMWGEEVKKLGEYALRHNRGRQFGRYLAMAADIGCLRPTAQQRAIELLLNVLVGRSRYNHLDEIIGAIHSRFLMQYLLEVLERRPDPHDQRCIKSIFKHMGEFAPIDVMLDEFKSEEHGSNRMALVRALIHLSPYVPPEKLVPFLRMRGFGRPQFAGEILKAIAKTKELPIQDLLTVLHDSDDDAVFYAACVLATVQHPAGIDPLLAQLNNPQSSQRGRALQALGQYKMLAPLDKLIVMLEDKNANIRKGVVEVLAQLGSAAPLEPLIRAANDPSEYVRGKAIEALGQLGDRAPLDVLIQATNDPEYWVACTAIKVLGQLGDHAPLDVLIQATNDSDGDVVCEAIKALGQLGDRVPVELLLGFLDKRGFFTPALEALSKKQIMEHVPDQFLLDLYERNWQERTGILNILANMGHPLASTLIINMFSNDGRYSILTAQRIEQRSSSLLTTERREVIGARCYPVYGRAIALLAFWQEQHVLDVLLRLLADERWRVSDAAADELCERANELVPTDLLALLTHRFAWVRKNVFRVIAASINLFPVEPLVAALHDSDAEVCAEAAKSLRTHGENAPLDELFAATLDGNWAAMVTLSTWGRRDPALGVAAVMNLLRREDSNGEAAKEAFEILSSYVPAEILLQALYDAGKIEIASFVAEALGKMGEERMPVEELAQALQDKRQYIRQAAASALAMSGKRAPVAALIKALKTKTPLKCGKKSSRLWLKSANMAMSRTKFSCTRFLKGVTIKPMSHFFKHLPHKANASFLRR